MDKNMERELGWEEEIEKDSEFVLLPEGDYPFKVESFERGRSKGSEKLPPCNMAILKIRVNAPNGQSTLITHNLILHTKMEGMLSAFFAGIGQKKKGEKAKMNWGMVPGSTGTCKLGIKTYNDNQYNEIKKFYPKDPSYQTDTTQPKVGNFTAGQF